MKLRLIAVGLLLSSLVGYLEWGGNNSGFLFQMEVELFSKRVGGEAFTHPFVFIPLAGQVLLLISVIAPNKKLVLAGIIMISLLVLMILLVGILSMKLSVIASTIPFLSLTIFFLVKRNQLTS